MSRKDPLNWMLSEAIDTLVRTERLHQQFFQPVHKKSRVLVPKDGGMFGQSVQDLLRILVGEEPI